MEFTLDLSKVSIPEMPELDKKQSEAVYSDRDTLVVAGPGTGKTRIVAAKAIRVYLDNLDSQVQTFKKDAAEELQRRLGTVGNPRTIHSEGLNRTGRYSFNRFDELIVPSPFPITDWSIMDEGQDQRREYYNVFKSLGSKHLLVADTWQTLFKWAEADPSILDDFVRDYNANVVELDTNYRSASSIVELGNVFSGRKLKPRSDAPTGKVNIGQDIPDLDNLCILVRSRQGIRSQSEYLQLRSIPHTTIISADSKRIITNWKDGKSWKVRSREEYFPTVISTIHCAKGTEWPRIWLLNWEPRGNLEEEKYCFYVGITRAIDELSIGVTRSNIFTRRLN